MEKFLALWICGCHIPSTNMKLEIDTSSPEELLKLRMEHESAIHIIDAVLSTLKQRRAREVAQFTNSAESSSNGGLEDVLAAVPFTFTSSDFYRVTGNDRRTEVKGFLQKKVESKEITILETGRGRKPTTYQKTA